MITLAKIRSYCLDALLITLLAFILLLFLEGASSLKNAFAKFRQSQVLAERIHTEYDPLLGWINKPNQHIPNMYGDHKYLKTNSQRFRNSEDTPVRMTESKSRWVCTGDSFTLGYGVDNDHTWCSLLAGGMPGIETVNMGQGGYGIDQAYLWYMRDGVKLEHDVLIFAFITDDIYRMSSEFFLGYPKPRLAVENGAIINKNSPVPPPGFMDRSFPIYKPLLQELHLVRLLLDITNKDDEGSPAQPSPHQQSGSLMELALSIFEEISTFNRALNRVVYFVHLPTQSDYESDPQEDEMRKTIHSNAEANHWHYIDLIQELKKLDSDEIQSLYIQEDIEGLYLSKGHYTEKGNQYIADEIARHILKAKGQGN